MDKADPEKERKTVVRLVTHYENKITPLILPRLVSICVVPIFSYVKIIFFVALIYLKLGQCQEVGWRTAPHTSVPSNSGDGYEAAPQLCCCRPQHPHRTERGLNTRSFPSTSRAFYWNAAHLRCQREGNLLILPSFSKRMTFPSCLRCTGPYKSSHRAHSITRSRRLSQSLEIQGKTFRDENCAAHTY